MVKDSKKYAATGGWGFADFTDGKPGSEALHEPVSLATRPLKIGTLSLPVTRRSKSYAALDGNPADRDGLR